MKNKWIWTACGIVLMLSIIATTIHINLVISDIRKATSQITIADIHRTMDIIERQQEPQLLEQTLNEEIER
jgi:23S rRNA U2552 (ribose-2'-O)-methylase RlmE/FtsJ